jgi:uncharacterized protein YndB with AHSA1/START domain
MGTSDENLVQLTRVLRAPPGEVFAAWTDPALLERWWIDVGGWVDAKADVDLHVGGRYHLSMRDERGALDGVVGVYTEVAQSRAPRLHLDLGERPEHDARERGEPRRRRPARGA